MLDQRRQRLVRRLTGGEWGCLLGCAGIALLISALIIWGGVSVLRSVPGNPGTTQRVLGKQLPPPRLEPIGSMTLALAHDTDLQSAAWSPDGETLVLAGIPSGGFARLIQESVKLNAEMSSGKTKDIREAARRQSKSIQNPHLWLLRAGKADAEVVAPSEEVSGTPFSVDWINDNEVLVQILQMDPFNNQRGYRLWRVNLKTRKWVEIMQLPLDSTAEIFAGPQGFLLSEHSLRGRALTYVPLASPDNQFKVSDDAFEVIRWHQGSAYLYGRSSSLSSSYAKVWRFEPKTRKLVATSIREVGFDSSPVRPDEFVTINGGLVYATRFADARRRIVGKGVGSGAYVISPYMGGRWIVYRQPALRHGGVMGLRLSDGSRHYLLSLDTYNEVMASPQSALLVAQEDTTAALSSFFSGGPDPMTHVTWTSTPSESLLGQLPEQFAAVPSP